MSELKSNQNELATSSPVLYEAVIDKLGRSYGTGKRKEAIAKVWIYKGNGKFTINDRPLTEYFARNLYVADVLKPFISTNMLSQFDVFCTVKGGGLTGQSGAIRLGLSNALQRYHPSTRKTLKQDGLLTRDSRVVERKKYGKHKARKSTQFSKR
jgi:small subunit ribosomal protein S9